MANFWENDPVSEDSKKSSSKNFWENDPTSEEAGVLTKFGRTAAGLADTAAGAISGTAAAIAYPFARAGRSADEAQRIVEENISRPMAQPFGRAFGVTQTPEYQGEASQRALQAVSPYIEQGVGTVAEATGLPKQDVESYANTLSMGIGAKMAPYTRAGINKIAQGEIAGTEALGGAVKTGYNAGANAVGGASDIVKGAYGGFTGNLQKPGSVNVKPWQTESARQPVGDTFIPKESLESWRQGQIPTNALDRKPTTDLNQQALAQTGGMVPYAGQEFKALGEQFGQSYRSFPKAALELGADYLLGGGLPTVARLGAKGYNLYKTHKALKELGKEGFTPLTPTEHAAIKSGENIYGAKLSPFELNPNVGAPQFSPNIGPQKPAPVPPAAPVAGPIAPSQMNLPLDTPEQMAVATTLREQKGSLESANPAAKAAADLARAHVAAKQGLQVPPATAPVAGPVAPAIMPAATPNVERVGAPTGNSDKIAARLAEIRARLPEQTPTEAAAIAEHNALPTAEKAAKTRAENKTKTGIDALKTTTTTEPVNTPTKENPVTTTNKAKTSTPYDINAVKKLFKEYGVDTPEKTQIEEILLRKHRQRWSAGAKEEYELLSKMTPDIIRERIKDWSIEKTGQKNVLDAFKDLGYDEMPIHWQVAEIMGKDLPSGQDAWTQIGKMSKEEIATRAANYKKKELQDRTYTEIKEDLAHKKAMEELDAKEKWAEPIKEKLKKDYDKEKVFYGKTFNKKIEKQLKEKYNNLWKEQLKAYKQ